jgi:hypothetical protein
MLIFTIKSSEKILEIRTKITQSTTQERLKPLASYKLKKFPRWNGKDSFSVQ